MRLFSFLKTHKMSVLSALLVALAAVLGADCSFAMAVVDPVDTNLTPNPSANMDPYDAEKNPEGRPAGEAPVNDEQGKPGQLPNHTQTATDLRDAGLLAEDYDEKTVEFRKFRFPEETIIARVCKPVKAKDYIHKHWETGSTDLDAVYSGENSITIAGNGSSTPYDASKKRLTIPAANFDNGEILTEFSTVVVEGVAGYKKDGEGNQVADGELVLFVENHKDGSANIIFRVINPPFKTSPQVTSVTIAPTAVFHVMATAGSESQMKVASDAFIPTDGECYLQKKIETATITDFFDESEKKMSFKTRHVLASAKENFKRKCARSHWNSTETRIDVMVPETGQREACYTEKGILRQIPMLYTHNADLTDDDFLAITTLMFTTNASNDHAYAFCGRRELSRIIKYANSAAKYKDIGKVEVNRFGIKIRKYEDNFGTLEFIWAQALDDLGYSDFMAVLDLENAERPYLVNDKQTTRDMSKTAEAREAKEYNLVRIDCIDLLGHNAVLVCPSAAALNAANLGGIEANFVSVSALPTGSALTPAAKLIKYYLTADCNPFIAGDVVEWDTELGGWRKFEGLVR